MINRNTVVFIDGVLHLRGLGSDTAIPLRHLAGHLVGALLPLWRVDFLFTGFAPIYLLELVHENGARATWYLDADARRLGDRLDELPALFLGMLKHLAAPAIDRLWRCLTTETKPASADTMTAALLHINAETRVSLAALCQEWVAPKATRLPLEDMPQRLHFNCRNGLIALQSARVTALLDAPFQDVLLDGFRNGVIQFPNPVADGSLSVAGAIIFDDFHFAYRLVDPLTSTVYFLFVMDHDSRSVFLYVPTLDLIIGFVPVLAVFGPFIRNLPGTLFSHVARYAAELHSYFQRDSFELVAITRGLPSVHMGHQLWNELTGLEALTLRLPSDRLPRCLIVSGREEVELFGKVETLFPALSGRVNRDIIHHQHLISACYAIGLCPARVTRQYVSQQLRQTIVALARQHVDFDDVQRALAADPPPLVIVIGIRVENRTAADLGGFLRHLFRHIADVVPGTVVVIDGHNSRPGTNDQMIESHLEGLAHRRPVDVERELAHSLMSDLVGYPIRIVDNIGKSITSSLAWLEHADGFIAFWGAGLAKYRWVANKPGLILTSRANLTSRGDLRIYDDPRWMENPTPVVFAHPGSITDDPAAELLVEVDSGPYYANFRVDEAAFFGQVDEMLMSWKSSHRSLAT